MTFMILAKRTCKYSCVALLLAVLEAWLKM